MKRSNVEECHALLSDPEIDQAQKLGLVALLRSVALKELEPVTEKIPNALPANAADIRSQHTFKLCHRVFDMDGITDSQCCAAEMLHACTLALEEGAVSDFLREWITVACSGLDSDSAELGKKHRATQSKRAQALRGKSDDGRTLGDLIMALVRSYPDYPPRELWPHLKSAMDDWADDGVKECAKGGQKIYKYEISGKPKTISYKQFGERLRKFKNAV